MAAAKKDPPKLSFIENLVLRGAGMSIGIVTTQTILAPIERVKLLLQNQGEMLKQGTISRPYTGAIDCTIQVFRNEFFHSFWRGNLTNCIFKFSDRVLTYVINDKIKVIFKQNRNHSFMVNFAINVGIGGVAGALPLSIVYSLDYARTRLATDVKNIKQGGNERKFISLIDVYRKTLATDGIAGLYRGFVISCVNIFIYRGCYFGLYDTLKPILLGPDASFRLSFLLGYGVTLTSGFISYPFDTIQRRMMMTSGEAIKYKGAMDCMFQIIRNEGTTALFKGVGVNIFKSIVGAGFLPIFDKLVILYTGVKVDTKNSG